MSHHDHIEWLVIETPLGGAAACFDVCNVVLASFQVLPFDAEGQCSVLLNEAELLVTQQ